MITNIKYIYSDTGEVEAAIVPIQAWRAVEKQLQTVPKPTTPFKASKFRGAFRKLNINVEEEIREMRDEWTRNF